MTSRAKSTAIKRLALGLAFGLAASLTISAVPAAAQSTYPSRPVHLVVPYPPGGSDTLARAIADSMSKATGATLVVDNVPGASTQVASRQVKNADPDGYTIYICSPPEFVAEPAFYSNLPFDPQKDFTLISYTAEAPYILLISPIIPATNYKEFVDYLAAHPADVRFGSYGALSQSDIIARRYRKETGIKFDIIPYAGGTPAFNGLLAGEIQAVFATSIPTRGFIKDKKMIPLGVTTGKRVDLYPDVPTLKELGVNLVDAASYGLVGPAGLPDDIVDYWQKNWGAAMNAPETKAFIQNLGVNIVASTPQEFRDWLTENTTLWAGFPEELGVEKKK